MEGSISSDFEIDRCVYYEPHEILISPQEKKKQWQSLKRHEGDELVIMAFLFLGDV